MKQRLAQGRINELERYITAAQGAASRAATLTHRLLAFSRQQTLEPKATDANRLVSTMEELVRRTVGPSIEIETVLAAGLWPCFCHPHPLENTTTSASMPATPCRTAAASRSKPRTPGSTTLRPSNGTCRAASTSPFASPIPARACRLRWRPAPSTPFSPPNLPGKERGLACP